MNKNHLWIYVIPLLLLGFALGARNLTLRPLWADESNSIRDSRGYEQEPRTPAEIWEGVADVNPDHVPGYFILINFWARFVGWEAAPLRALALLIGMLVIAITYRFGRDWLSERAGLVAAAALSVSAYYAFFMGELRVYTTMSLLSILTLSVYFRIINSPGAPKRRWWIALLACVVGTLYSHYLGIITLIGIGVYHLLFVPRNRRWWIITGVVLLGGLTFIPWAWVLVKGLNQEADNTRLHEQALSATEALAAYFWMFSNSIVVLMVGLIAAAIAVARGRTAPARHARQLLIITTAALLALLVINQALQIMHAGRLRYMIPLWPLSALVVGVGAAALWRWKPVMIGVVALWLVAGTWSTLFANLDGQLDNSTLDIYPIDRVSQALVGYAERKDLVVNYVPDSVAPMKDDIFRYYFKIIRQLPVDYTIADKRYTPKDQANLEKRLWQTFEGRRRIWIGYSATEVPSDLGLLETQMLERGWIQCDPLTHDPEIVLDLFVAQGVDCPQLDAPSKS